MFNCQFEYQYVMSLMCLFLNQYIVTHAHWCVYVSIQGSGGSATAAGSDAEFDAEQGDVTDESVTDRRRNGRSNGVRNNRRRRRAHDDDDASLGSNSGSDSNSQYGSENDSYASANSSDIDESEVSFHDR